MRYELFYLVGISQEPNLETIKKEVAEMVTSLGGVFEEKETLEKRKLSYEVKHETHGIYIAQRFELEEVEKIKELLATLNLYNQVLRFIISKADELPPLKSKEERIDEAAKKEAITTSRREKEEKIATANKEAQEEKLKVLEKNQEKKPATKETRKEQKEKKEGGEKEEKKTDSSIDKKLEEILNI